MAVVEPTVELSLHPEHGGAPIDRVPVTQRDTETIRSFADEEVGVNYSARFTISSEFTDIWERATAIEPTGEVFDQDVSAHQVAFARVVGPRQLPSGVVREKQLSGVAIKMVGDVDSAIHELRGYEILRVLGIETFTPIGIAQDIQKDPRESSVFLMTARRNDILSLEQDNWVVGMEPVNEEEVAELELNIITVKEISQLMAWMHINGVFHPDGQVKNWMATSSRTIGVIDPEKLVSQPVGHEHTAENMWDDIIKLYKSLRMGKPDPEGIYGVGMLHGLSEGAVMEAFDQLTIQPYQEMLLQALEELEGRVSSEEMKGYYSQTETLISALSSYRDRLQEVMCVN